MRKKGYTNLRGTYALRPQPIKFKFGLLLVDYSHH